MTRNTEQHKQNKGERKAVTLKKRLEGAFDQCEDPYNGRNVGVHLGCIGRRTHESSEVIFCVSAAVRN